MINYKINIIPIQKIISCSIEGDFDELDSIDITKIKKLNAKIEKLSKELGYEESVSSIQEYKTKITGKKSNDSIPILHVPDDLMQKIEELDERKKFPVLWSFSSNPIMTVDEFLTECTAKGFTLSPNWLPTAGGYFSTTMVKGAKILRKVAKKGNKTTWTPTDMGKLKIKQMINDLKKS